MKKTVVIGTILAVALAFSGCGQKTCKSKIVYPTCVGGCPTK
jgi:PBP1b-binding outer membrane lipoprotein LpoB